MTQYWWVPLAICSYILYAWLSKRSNEDSSYIYVIYLYLIQALGLWPLIAKFSKNLLFDGILFDFIIITTFYLCNSCKNWFHYKDYNIVAFLCNSCKKMKDKQVKNSKKEKRK